MLLKTFILATPNFVEVLNVMGSLCEFFPELIKMVRASFKIPNCCWFKKKEKQKKGKCLNP